jgi:hypothetical protein
MLVELVEVVGVVVVLVLVLILVVVLLTTKRCPRNHVRGRSYHMSWSAMQGWTRCCEYSCFVVVAFKDRCKGLVAAAKAAAAKAAAAKAAAAKAAAAKAAAAKAAAAKAAAAKAAAASAYTVWVCAPCVWRRMAWTWLS